MSRSNQKNCVLRQRKSFCNGLTLVELISVLVIVAILALVAVPRFFDHQTFDARIFHDQALSMLRYAQKVAIAQNRNVYARLDGASFAFCFNAFAANGYCDNPVLAPSQNSGSAATLARCSDSNTWFCEAVPAGFSYTAPPITDTPTSAIQGFYFNALGKPFHSADTPPNSSFSRLDISLSGSGLTQHLFVEPETGYVHP